MKFIYHGDVYAINFQRRQVLVRAYSGGEEGNERLSKYPSTEVFLLKLDPKEFGTKNAEVIAFGSTACYHKDRFDPEIGRRNALKNLCTSPRNRISVEGKAIKVTREMSALIWKAYFNRYNPDVEVSDEPSGNNTPLPPPNSLETEDGVILNEAYVVG